MRQHEQNGTDTWEILVWVLNSNPTTYNPNYLFNCFTNLGLSDLICKMGILMPDEVAVRNKIMSMYLPIS